MEWLWVSVAIAFLVIELTTKRLVAVWAAVSALTTTLIDVAFTSVGLLWQGVIFLSLSAILILISYPITKKLFNKSEDKTKNEQD